MGVIAGWEEFLERSLVRYVAKASTSTGYAPTPKFGSATNLQHAYDVLYQGTFDPAKHYLKASDAAWVRRTADFYFSSHPYGCLMPQASLLNHAASIRNRVAHSSTKCRSDFKATALHFLAPASGKLSQGFGPGALLLQPVRRHFPAPAVAAGLSHLEAYFQLYESLANRIVP